MIKLAFCGHVDSRPEKGVIVLTHKLRITKILDEVSDCLRFAFMIGTKMSNACCYYF